VVLGRHRRSVLPTGRRRLTVGDVDLVRLNDAEKWSRLGRAARRPPIAFRNQLFHIWSRRPERPFVAARPAVLPPAQSIVADSQEASSAGDRRRRRRRRQQQQQPARVDIIPSRSSSPSTSKLNVASTQRRRLNRNLAETFPPLADRRYHVDVPPV